ncbi:hypothetical protein CTAYLR_001845 [Chrysophaeum taylorii]|uniref:EF-hand domain-containing protein n=1 Tax=Chrysophaeum taylorii TaxID=2483200 RepID=A0AAD7U887_9STRA|nr:hypothetical protein CTAYLR_001845 [Chrysophaeum taylorii]
MPAVVVSPRGRGGDLEDHHHHHNNQSESFEVGEAVEARRGSRWFPATIRARRRNEYYELDFDDGEYDTLPARYIKRKPLSVGEAVEGRFGGGEKWYPATVARAHADGTADLEYADGDDESRVPAELVRRRRRNKWTVGRRVEARIRGEYRPATVRRVNRDGTLELDFEDGEARVRESFVRDARRYERTRPSLSDQETRLMSEHALVSRQARAELREWARRGPRVEDMADLPRRLRNQAERVVECFGRRPNWVEVLDFLRYPPESKRLTALRRRLRVTRDVTRHISAGKTRVSAGELRSAFLENDGRPFGGRGREPIVSERDVEAVCERFADDNDGLVDSEAVARWLRVAESDDDDDDDKVLRRATRKLAAGLRQLKVDDPTSLFRRLFDRDDRGVCAADDFREGASCALALPLAPAELDALVAEHETAAGTVDYRAVLGRDQGDKQQQQQQGSSRASRFWRRAFGGGSNKRRDRSSSGGSSPPPPVPSDDDDDDDDDDDRRGEAKTTTTKKGPFLVSKRGARALARAVAEQRGGAWAVFEDHGHRLGLRELRRCLFSRDGLDADVPDEDQENLLSALMPEGKNDDERVRVAWADFADFLEELEDPAQRDVEKRLASAFDRLSKGKPRHRSRAEILAEFEERDRKKTGHLKADDFQAVIKRLFSASLSTSEREAVARKFAAAQTKAPRRPTLALNMGQNNIQVRYAAFVRWLTADPVEADRKLARSLKLVGSKDGDALRRAIDRLDDDDDFGFRTADFVRFVRAANIPLSDGELRGVCRVRDREGELDARNVLKLADRGEAAALEVGEARDDERRRRRNGRADHSDDSKNGVSARVKDKLWRWARRSETRRAFARLEDKKHKRRELRSMLADAVGREEADSLVELFFSTAPTGEPHDEELSLDDFLGFCLTKRDANNERSFETLDAIRRGLAKNSVDHLALSKALKKRGNNKASAPAVVKVLDAHLYSPLSSSQRRALRDEFGEDVDCKALAARLCANLDAALVRLRGAREEILKGIKRADLFEFRHELLCRLNLPLSDAEVGAVFDASARDGFVDACGLAKLLDERRGPNKDDDDDEWEEEEVDPEIALLSGEFRVALRAWARSERDRGGLRAVFAEFDANGDGELSAREVRKMLRKVLADVDDAELNTLMDCLDADGDGRVDWTELASFARPPETKKLMAIRREVRRQLIGRRQSRWFKRSALDVAAVLGALDAKSQGSIPSSDFKRALVKPPLNLELKLGEASAVARYFEDDGVDYVAFARWLGSDAAGHTAWEYGGSKKLSGKALRRRLGLREAATDDDVRAASERKALERAERKVAVALDLVSDTERLGLSREALRKRFFARVDRNADGRLTRLELRKAFARLGVPFAVDEINALLDKFDTNGDGLISYAEFKCLFTEATEATDSASNKKKRRNKRRHDDDDDDDGVSVAGVARRIRAAIRGDGKGGGIGDWANDASVAFAEMDKDSSGDVSGREFAAWLCDRLRIKLSKQERAALLDCLDTDGNGTVSYNEFVDFVLEPPPEGDEIGLIAARLRDDLGVKGCAELRHDLERRAPQGLVRAKDLRDALAKAGADVDASDERVLSKRFGGTGGKIRYDHLCAWLEAGLGDNALDKLRRKIRSLEKRRGGQRVDAREVFRGAASKGKGLTREDLGRACDKCGIYLSDPVLAALMKRFDADDNGTVEWGEFRRVLFDEDDAKKNEDQDDDDDDKMMGAFKTTTTTTTKTKEHHKELDAELATTIEALFTFFDANGDGKLSRVELEAAVPHALRAFGLQPTEEDAANLVDAVKRSTGESRYITYQKFEDAAIRHVREELEKHGDAPRRRATAMAELRERLDAMDVRANGQVSRGDFEALCLSQARMSKDEAEALASTCAAYDDDDDDDDGTTTVEPSVDVDEVMRLVRAATTGGADAARDEAAAAPWRRRFAVPDRDQAARAGAAALKLARCVRPNPASYLMAFLPGGLLPKSSREPALAAVEPTRSLAATLAPAGLLATAAAARNAVRGSRRRTELHVIVCEARAVPTPKGSAGVQRFVRCCLVRRGERTSPCEAAASNVHRVRAGRAASRPDCWIFEKSAPYAVGVPPSNRPKPPPDAREWARIVSRGLDTNEMVVVADERKPSDADDLDSKLALLLELTMRLPKKYFHKKRSRTTTTTRANLRPRGDDDDDDENWADEASDDPSEDYGLSDSEDEDNRRRRRRPHFDKDSEGEERRRRRRREDDADRVYSDDDDEEETTKKREKRASNEKPRSIWYKRRLRDAKAQKTEKKRSQASPRGLVKDDDEVGVEYVEVSCGWSIVSLDQLREREGSLCLEVKGGSPFAEDAIARADIPWQHRGVSRRVAQAVLGYSLKSRLHVRVKPLPRDHPLKSASQRLSRAAVVPEPYARIVAAYARYLDDFLAQHAQLADPVLAVFRKLLAVETFRVALRALWLLRFEELRLKHAPPMMCAAPSAWLRAPTKQPPPPTKQQDEHAALQKAVLELWPLCDSLVLQRRRDDTSAPFDRHLSRAQIQQHALDLLRPLADIADVKQSSGFDDRPNDTRDDPPKQELFAPFHTRELML